MVTTKAAVVAGAADGHGIAWEAGEFGGDPDLVRRAIEACTLEMPVQFGPFGGTVVANLAEPAGAAAAMLAAAPGRLILTEAPDDVLGLFADVGDDLILTDDELDSVGDV